MKNRPKISVVTPSYNQAAFLEQTILSVLEQDYDNVEYIIIDGGSNDGSVDIIRRYSDQLSYWVSAPDGGQSEAINKGFEHATGDIYCWLNSDDYFERGALCMVAKHFSSNPEWRVLNGGCRIIDERYPDHQYTRSLSVAAKDALDEWTQHWFAQPSTFWSRDLWQQVGPVRNDLHFVMDIELWKRFLLHTSIHGVTDVLATCRMHDSAKCASSYTQVISEMFVLLFDEYPDVNNEFKEKVLRQVKEVAAGSERALAANRELASKLSLESSLRGALQSEATALRDSRWLAMGSTLKNMFWRR